MTPCNAWGVRLTHTLKNLTVRGAGPKRVLVPFFCPKNLCGKAYHLYMSLGILRWPPYDLFERDQQPQPLLGSTKVRRPVILCRPGRQITNRYVVLQQPQCSYVGQLSIGCQDQSRQVGHCARTQGPTAQGQAVRKLKQYTNSACVRRPMVIICPVIIIISYEMSPSQKWFFCDYLGFFIEFAETLSGKSANGDSKRHDDFDNHPEPQSPNPPQSCIISCGFRAWGFGPQGP